MGVFDSSSNNVRILRSHIDPNPYPEELKIRHIFFQANRLCRACKYSRICRHVTDWNRFGWEYPTMDSSSSTYFFPIGLCSLSHLGSLLRRGARHTIRLLKQRNIAFSCILYFFTLASYYSNIYYIPIYLQTRGYSTTQAGLRFITQGAGTAVSLFYAGILIKWTGRYYHLNVAAMVVIVTGSGLLIILRLDTGA
jgi:hypothetical protein